MNLNQTTNYQLSQWESTDRILMADFNSDNSKIDAALKAHSDAIAGKAAQSTVNSLTQTVSTKANQSDLTALTQTVSGKASQSDLNSLTQTVDGLADQVGLRGNCQIEFQTYVGSGQCGETHPSSLTFSAPPALFFIACVNSIGYCARGTNVLWTRPGSTVSYCNGSWSGSTFTWSATSQDRQLNTEGRQYTVVALIPLDDE